MAKEDLGHKEVATLCEALLAEPLFHMSLGSKELFHSNLIAWFADQFPALAAGVFATWTDRLEGAQGRHTEREPAHLDLVLHLPELAPIAIENKVFSVPDESQLDRYAEGAVGQREAGGVRSAHVLLSLMSPGWQNNAYNGWRLHTYDELADALASQVQLVRATDPFAADLLDHYVGFIRLLTTLVAMLGTPAPGAPLLLPSSVVRQLETARVSAAIQKARASHVARALRLAIAEHGWSHVTVAHGFSNGTSLIEAYRRLPTVGSDGTTGDYVGWQVQGTQFRLAIVTGRLLGAERRLEREQYVAERYRRWFDFDLFEEVVGAEPSVRVQEVRGGRWSFQGYNPSFVYRYRTAPNLTPAQVLRLGIGYLERAEQLF